MVSVDTELSDISEWICGDIWSFGCSVLKIFLSYSGPHNQREVGIHKNLGTINFNFFQNSVAVGLYHFFPSHS